LASLEEKLKDICAPAKSPAEVAVQTARPRGEEVILASRTGDAGLHIRGDEAVELYAGGVRVLASSAQDVIGATASRLYLIGRDIRLSAFNELSLDGYVLEDWYFRGQQPTPDPSSEADKFVLVPKDASVLHTPIKEGDTLSSFVELRPLLRRGANEALRGGFLDLLREGLL